MKLEKKFLVYSDYDLQIQKKDLFQILEESDSEVWDDISDYSRMILDTAEMAGIEEMKSYIRARFTDEVFPPTQLWASGTTFFGKNLVVYNEPAFDFGATYNIGDRFSYKNDDGIDWIYSTISGSTSGISPSYSSTTVGLTSQTYSYVTENNMFYNANLPCSEYSKDNNYSQGNLVWYQDNIYQAKQNINGQSPAQSQNMELRYGIPASQSYSGVWNYSIGLINNPLPNVNTNFWNLYNGPVSTWFTGTTYYFTGQTPDNTTYWDKSDNRNPQIRMMLVDIILYHLNSRLNPRNIAEKFAIRYDGNHAFQTGGAIGWLKKVMNGQVNLNCPEISNNIEGNSIIWGSYPKTNNYF